MEGFMPRILILTGSGEKKMDPDMTENPGSGYAQKAWIRIRNSLVKSLSAATPIFMRRGVCGYVFNTWYVFCILQGIERARFRSIRLSEALWECVELRIRV